MQEQVDKDMIIAELRAEINRLNDKLATAEECVRQIAGGDWNAPCDYCVYQIECCGKDCPGYESDTVMYKGKEVEWSCLDYDYGKCKVLEHTPCCDCDFKKHFKWNGKVVKNEQQ